MVSQDASPLLWPQSGASQVPGIPLCTRRPQSPRRSPANALACCFFTGSRLQQIRMPGHSSCLCNEAESGSLALRLALSSHKASQVGSPLAALIRLHVKQAIDMVDSFQSTRYTRLRLAHRMKHGLKQFVQNWMYLRFAIWDFRVHRLSALQAAATVPRSPFVEARARVARSAAHPASPSSHPGQNRDHRSRARTGHRRARKSRPI